MSDTGGGDCGAPPEMTLVVLAVVVKGDDLGGFDRGRGRGRTVCWAVQNLMPKANRFILVHVMPRVTSIPTPENVLPAHVTFIHALCCFDSNSYTCRLVTLIDQVNAGSFRLHAVFLAGGDRIPVAELNENVVVMYVEDTKVKFEQVFAPFKTEI